MNFIVLDYFILISSWIIAGMGLGLALAMVQNTYQLSTLSKRRLQLQQTVASGQVSIRASSAIDLERV